ncbi:hypothetical protein OB13_10430 [Pontibacter sp. HJ8]
MTILHKLKATAVAGLVLGAVSFSGAAVAQQKNPPKQKATPPAAQQQPQAISDADLQQFVDASSRLMELQKANEQTMLTILQEEKLSVEKFNELAQAQQQQKLETATATAEEKAAFNKAIGRMMEMQPTIEQDMRQAIQKDGMTMERYEQIMLAYQQDTAIQAKIQKMMGL